MFKYTNNTAIKKEIDKLLIDKDISKADIAKQLGVSPQRVSNMLVKKQLNFADIQKILDCVDCSLYIDFVDNNTDPKK